MTGELRAPVLLHVRHVTRTASHMFPPLFPNTMSSPDYFFPSTTPACDSHVRSRTDYGSTLLLFLLTTETFGSVGPKKRVSSAFMPGRRQHRQEVSDEVIVRSVGKRYLGCACDRLARLKQQQRNFKNKSIHTDLQRRPGGVLYELGD